MIFGHNGNKGLWSRAILFSSSSGCDRSLLSSDAVEQTYIQPDVFKAEINGKLTDR